MGRQFCLALIVGVFAIAFAFGDNPTTHEKPVNGSKPAGKLWSEILGTEVAAEGIAWGSVEKGHGPYLILNDARIYVAQVDFLKEDIEGCLVRVSGILRAERDKSRTGVRYIIDARKFERLSKVTWPWLRRTRPSE